MMDAKVILRKLQSLENRKNREGMARFGIETKNAYGISLPTLRTIAKEIGTDHLLALKLWNAGVHESRLLACFIDDPAEVTERQMEEWVREFDSWDICDQCCGFLFDKTKYARKKALHWSRREGEFNKRAGFVLMAALSVHDKDADDSDFVKFFQRIEAESDDERNFVRKAVNWALRQIGKRNLALNKMAIEVAESIRQIDSSSARWIASDALRELKNKKLQLRLSRKS